MNPLPPPAHEASPDPRLSDPPDLTTVQALGDKNRRLRKRSLLFGTIGLGLQATRYIDSGGLRPASDGELLYVVLPVVGIGLLVYALSLSARARNRSQWWGVLGIGSCVGWIGFLLLSKRCHFCGTKMRGQRCPHCGRQEPR